MYVTSILYLSTFSNFDLYICGRRLKGKYHPTNLRVAIERRVLLFIK